MPFQLDVDDLGEVGFIKDLPNHRLPKNAWTDANHARFGLRGVTQINNERPVLSTDSKVGLQWVKQFPPTSNPLWVYSIVESGAGLGDAKIWLEASPSHIDLTRISSNYNSVLAERPHGGVFQGSGYWNNVKDIPQWWSPMTSGTKFIDIPNWATHIETGSLRCKFLRPYRNFLMMGNLSEIGGGAGAWPFAVRWSDAAVPGAAPSSYDISDPANLANEFNLSITSDHIIDGLVLGEVFIVYKELTTWGIQFVGGQNIMRQWKIFDDLGILWRDCVATYPKGHFVVTQTDIIVHTGIKGSEQSILEHKLRRWLFSILNTASFQNSFCVTVAARKEIWFFFPTGTSADKNADTVLIWSWANNTVGIRGLPVEGIPFAAAGLINTSTEPLAWG